jgi:hypothetical protein
MDATARHFHAPDGRFEHLQAERAGRSKCSPSREQVARTASGSGRER